MYSVHDTYNTTFEFNYYTSGVACVRIPATPLSWAVFLSQDFVLCVTASFPWCSPPVAIWLLILLLSVGSILVRQDSGKNTSCSQLFSFPSHSFYFCSWFCDADSRVIGICKVFPRNMNIEDEKAVSQPPLQKKACLNDSYHYTLTQLMFFTDAEKILSTHA